MRCPEASSVLGSAPIFVGTFLPPSNDVLWLCSCAGPPDGEVDKLPGADGMRVVTVDGLICLAAIDFTAAVCATGVDWGGLSAGRNVPAGLGG